MIDYLTLVLMTNDYSFCLPLFTVILAYLLRNIRLAVPHPRISSSGFPLLNCYLSGSVSLRLMSTLQLPPSYFPNLLSYCCHDTKVAYGIRQDLQRVRACGSLVRSPPFAVSGELCLLDTRLLARAVDAMKMLRRKLKGGHLHDRQWNFQNP